MEGSDSRSENSHVTRERKEKKKKGKVADASGTQPEIVKGGRTKKKKVVEPEPAPSNLEGKEKKKKREESPSSDKGEKKKRKKEKISGTTSDPASAVPALEATDTPEVTTVAASEVKEKKKRRKGKPSTDTPNPSTSVIEPALSTGGADELKRRTAKDDTGVNGEPLSKKRKKGEGEGDSARKRKKSKTSIHPDPSDDPDLTEQSRKALKYVLSQSTSPKTWKFNKARQNWIIRNIWSSKVPEKYVPMVVDYLSKVQGRVRESLIESCNNVVSDPNSDPPATQAGADEKENPDSAVPGMFGSERTQRAKTLLCVLIGHS